MLAAAGRDGGRGCGAHRRARAGRRRRRGRRAPAAALSCCQRSRKRLRSASVQPSSSSSRLSTFLTLHLFGERFEHEVGLLAGVFEIGGVGFGRGAVGLSRLHRAVGDAAGAARRAAAGVLSARVFRVIVGLLGGCLTRLVVGEPVIGPRPLKRARRSCLAATSRRRRCLAGCCHLVYRLPPGLVAFAVALGGAVAFFLASRFGRCGLSDFAS